MIELTIILSLLGLSLGSFINVCAYRLPRGVSVLTLRSFCPSCNHRLTWYELIPVVGYALNRGRCRYCKERISPSYPIVEIISAGILFALLLKYGITLEFALSSIFCLLMVLIAIIDWKHLIIPNQIVIVGLITGFLIKGLLGETTIIDGFLSSILSFLTLLVVMLLCNFFLKKQSMGMGDVKLAAVIGLFLGYRDFLIALWLAAVTGAFYGIITNKLSNRQLSNRQSSITNHQSRITHLIPFGSFLAVAACVVLYFQENILELIQSWLTYAQ